MKKVMTLILCLVVLVSLVGCSKEETKTTSNNSVSSSESSNKKLEWPTEAITMTCPWSVGGIADMAIRAIAEYGEDYFGQPIVPVNRTGAGGAVAITEFLKEKPNTPALIMASEGTFATLPLQNDVAYKWENFTPVIGVTTSSFAIVTNPEKGINNFDDLLAYGKDNKIIFASSGIGSDNYLLAAALFKMAGIEYETIGYPGSADAMNAVIAGDVILAITHPSLAKENVKAGNLTAIAVFDDENWVDEVYDIPAVTSFGYDAVLPNLNFLVMPAGTDEEIVQLAHDNIKKIFQEEGFKEFTKKLDLVINPATPEEIEQHIESSIESAKRFYELVNN